MDPRFTVCMKGGRQGAHRKRFFKLMKNFKLHFKEQRDTN